MTSEEAIQRQINQLQADLNRIRAERTTTLYLTPVPTKTEVVPDAQPCAHCHRNPAEVQEKHTEGREVYVYVEVSVGAHSTIGSNGDPLCKQCRELAERLYQELIDGLGC